MMKKATSKSNDLELRMQLMTLEGKRIDRVLINLIIDEQIEGSTSMYTVKHLFKTNTYLLTCLWPVGALLTASYTHMF